MLAICHYNLIVDEKKDLGEIIKAKEYFIFLVEEFPNTDFAEDSKFKLELIEEILASKELYLANYYLERDLQELHSRGAVTAPSNAFSVSPTGAISVDHTVQAVQ